MRASSKETKVGIRRRIAVACLDCSHCAKENVIGVARKLRKGLEFITERAVICRHCRRPFTRSTAEIQIRRKSEEVLVAQYGWKAVELLG